MKMKFTFLSLLMFCMQIIHAQNSAYDKTFGTNAAVITEIFPDDHGKSLLTQPDDKILVAGSYELLNDIHFYVHRYLSNGKPDITFGTNGIVTISIADKFTIYPRNMILQPDGKILLLSNFHVIDNSNSEKSLIHRLDKNGNLDITFGNNGVIESSANNVNEHLNNCVLLPDGSIICIGTTTSDTSFKSGILVKKYDKNGKIDNKFGKNGRFTYFSNESSIVLGVDIDVLKKDGSLIFFAEHYTGISSSFLIKTDSIGNLDNTFGKTGIVRINDAKNDNLPLKLKILPNDKILIMNIKKSDDYKHTTFLKQYTADGNVDKSFADNGVMTFKNPDYVYYMGDFRLTPNKKILTTGSLRSIGKNTLSVLQQFDLNGNIDKTFGNKGSLILDYGNSNTWFFESALKSDCKIICTASAYIDDRFSNCIVQIDPTKFDTAPIATDLKNIQLFPNPVTNQVTLSIELSTSQSLDIQLFDINGRFISDFNTANKKFSACKNEIVLELPSSLTSGTYFVNIRSQEGVSVVKMVKM